MKRVPLVFICPCSINSQRLIPSLEPGWQKVSLCTEYEKYADVHVGVLGEVKGVSQCSTDGVPSV